MASHLTRGTEDLDSLPTMKEVADELTASGWQQITPCRKTAYEGTENTHEMMGFSGKEGWELYVLKLTYPGGLGVLSYLVADYEGFAAAQCRDA